MLHVGDPEIGWVKANNSKGQGSEPTAINDDSD